MTALPCQAILGTPGSALPAPEWPGSHDEARGSIPPSGPALVTCRHRVVGGRCGDVLRPSTDAPRFFVHTHKPAVPHYAVPWRIGEIES